MSERSGCRWGTHPQFVRLYETFLDAAYANHPSSPDGNGRRKLAMSVGHEIRSRGAEDILDCAAGTGFPALDLIADGLTVHCSDGDAAMANVLVKQAARRGLDLQELTPPRRPGIKASKDQPLVLDWTQLEYIPRRYDYVLCRGNSLAYADTWNGKIQVANDQVTTTHLERMLWRVRPGGYLHVDAPWQLQLPTMSYRPVGHSGSIWEQVTADATHREWTVSFKAEGGGRPLAFCRYSSLLTIDRVEAILKGLGMENTAPFQLAGERPAFGTIIARRPTQRPRSMDSSGRDDERRINTRMARSAEATITFPWRQKRPSPQRGSHAEFVDHYERYLDATYAGDAGGQPVSGRWRLMRSIAAEIRTRRAITVLDCAAGTGFPLVDLAANTRGEFRIHCSDGDRLMVDTMARRAKELGVPLADLTPHRPGKGDPPMTLNWSELGDLTEQYDYVLCRGNSLAYADTWAGNDKVATEKLISTYLASIAERVRPGGYLHLDAPRTLDLEATTRDHGVSAIWEQVSVDRDRREWWLKFDRPNDRPLEFKRYSSVITIDDLRRMLDRLGFTDTEPIELDGERASFGVIIARKPR